MTVGPCFDAVRCCQSLICTNRHFRRRKRKEILWIIIAAISVSVNALHPVPPTTSRHNRQAAWQWQLSATPRIGNNKPAAVKTRARRPTLSHQLSYARDGHTVLRQWIEPHKLLALRKPLQVHARQGELQAWRQKVQVASNDPKMARSCQTVKDCQKCLQGLGIDQAIPFLQYFNSWRSIPLVYDLICELAESAATLLDVSSVRLYHDSIFWKRPQDGPTPWHVDARMAPFDTNHLVTFWIPLYDVSQSSGLVFCSKSHNDVALTYWYNDNNMPSSLEERYQHHALVDYMPLTVGDVTVHSGWTLHCADCSIQHERWALAISYVDAAAPIRLDHATTTTTSQSSGDNEDLWSYQDWIQHVPRGSSQWKHPLVPIVWPRSSKPKLSR